jgi:glycosyltransferase involved in cell wall biosynthesis
METQVIPSMKTVLILREKFTHMGSHSGYDMLFNFNGSNKDLRIKSIYLSPEGRPFWFKVLQRLGYRKDINDYSFSQYVLGIKTYLYTLFFRPSIIHFTFIEENLRFLNWKHLMKVLKKRTAIIGTSHQPVGYWKDRKESMLLNQLDGLVVLNSNLSSYYSSQLPSVRVIEMSHPVDTVYFKKSADGIIADNRCLFIGYWLRDFDCLFNTIRTAASRKSGLQFDLVIPAHGIRRLGEALENLPMENVLIHTGISDDALLGLFNTANCLFLPLTDFTANNSLLEAMACELPVVVATNNMDSIYFDTAAAKIFPPAEVDNIIEFMEQLQVNTELRSRMGKKARQFAEQQCSIAVTQHKMLDTYKSFI